MPQPSTSTAPATARGANGHSSLDDLFVLTDEQILEIDPEPQGVAVNEDPAPVPELARESSSSAAATPPEQQTQSAQPGARIDAQDEPLPSTPPAWLAAQMNDTWNGAEARALWESAQQSQKEAASYRQVFAKPEDARAAADRARMLDDIDRAYFVGDAAQRTQLAAMMMREDPAAFREMVFAGLRALEEAGHAPKTRSIADALNRPRNASSPAAAESAAVQATLVSPSAHAEPTAAQQSRLAEYAAFERAANDDLERSVGAAIERTIGQALPNLARSGESASVGTRLSAAIRQDVEKALQGDRQLGEQVAQILSAKRLDGETRAQVVRLIGERAQQLVPVATRRALNDWTQTTLAAHRRTNARTDTPPARREVAPAAAHQRDSQEHNARPRESARAPRPEARSNAKGRVDYGKLSDEQILNL